MPKFKVGGFQVECINSAEAHRLKREIWGYHVYYLDPDKYVDLSKKSVKILDGGAYIGLSSLYFARMYRRAEIVALEPNPESFGLLERNIWENQVEGIECEQVALADKESERWLYRDRTKDGWWSTAGFIEGAWNGEQESERIKVRTKTLSSYLEKQKWDVVKLDIEGAEEEVLLEAKEVINRASCYLIEFHPVKGGGMEKIVRLFQDNGYCVEVRVKGKKVKWHKARGLALIVASK